MSKGNFSHDIDANRRDEVGQLLTALKMMQGDVLQTFELVQASAASLAVTSEQASAIADQAVENTAEHKAALNSTSSSLAEMSSTVAQVAENTRHAVQAAQEADSNVTEGMAIVNETIGAINDLASGVESTAIAIEELAEQSDTIGGVLEVIKGIADQTNLLALNAAIEAARAGEQGRGFAVVADEVRTLASRTHESTEQIKKMIEQLQSGTNQAVEAMASGRKQAAASVEHATRAGDSLVAIKQATELIITLNRQIANGIEEQSRASRNLENNVISIGKIADSASARSDGVASASTSVADQVGQMQQLMRNFKF